MSYYAPIKSIKTDGPNSDYLVVDKDGQHLRVKKNGTPDHRLMGGAWAALHKGYRGNKYEGSDKGKAIDKLTALYKSEKMELPSGKSLFLKDAGDSLEEQRQDAYDAFTEQFNPDMAMPSMGMCIVETYPDHLIVCDDDVYYSVPYIVDVDENYIFADRADWEQVEQIWVPETEGEQVPAGTGVTGMQSISSLATMAFDDVLIAYGSPVKATELPDGGVKLGGYVITYGDPQHPDLSETKDFFSENTDFGDATEADGWFNHRLPVVFEDRAVQYKRRLPKVRLIKDDAGVFGEIILKARNDYEAELVKLGLAGKLSFSSGTATHLVDRKSMPNGTNEVLSWPLGLDVSITPTPAEPRNVVVPLKSLLGVSNKGTTNPTPAQAGTAPASRTGISAPPSMSIKTKEIFDMDKNELLAILDERDARKAAADKAAADAKAAHDAEIKTAVDTALEKQADEFKLNRRGSYKVAGVPGQKKITERGETNEEMKSFFYWLATGDQVPYEASMSDGTKAATAKLRAGGSDWAPADGATKAALAGQSDAAGGYAVPDDFYNQIVAKRTELSITDRMGVIRIPTSLDRILVPTEGTAATKFIPIPEANAYDENEPTFGQVPITVWKFTKLIKISEELEVDAQGRFGSYLANVWARAMALSDNYYYVASGTGTGQPQAMATGATDCGTTPASATAVTAAEVLAMIYNMPAAYTDNMALIMRRATLGAVRALTGNFFAFMPTPGGALTETNPNVRGRGPDGYLHDIPVYATDAMPAMAALAKSFLLSNPDFYAVAERESIGVSRNPWLYQNTGQIGLFAKYRAGGAVLQAEAHRSMSMHS